MRSTTWSSAWRPPPGCSVGITFNRERLAAAAEDEMLAATDLADALVQEGVPFREAHGLVGGLVKAALDSGKSLSELSDSELDGVPEDARQAVRRALEAGQDDRVEGLRRRHGLSPCGGATRAGARGAHGPAPVNRQFFDRSVHEVARDLIGCRLAIGQTAGIIVETEAYEASDPACHAYIGRTARNEVLFGPPGHAYVYLSYGIHSLLNFVTEPEGTASAVLIRALEPTDGHRPDARAAGPEDGSRLSAPGPGKLTEALGIDLSLERGGPVRSRRSSSASRPASWATVERGDRTADRHHQGGRAALALLRQGKPVRLAALAGRG